MLGDRWRRRRGRRSAKDEREDIETSSIPPPPPQVYPDRGSLADSGPKTEDRRKPPDSPADRPEDHSHRQTEAEQRSEPLPPPPSVYPDRHTRAAGGLQRDEKPASRQRGFAEPNRDGRFDGPMIHCDNLVRIYKTAEIEVVALQGLDLSIDQGEVMAIIGNSGSGKSTLLNIIGGLDLPSAGAVSVAGKDLLKFDDDDLIRYRRETVGFVWQNAARNLIPYLTARENVEIPMNLAHRPSRRRAEELLEIVGLSHRRESRLSELSGGEQQRVAIAIALANSPPLILADEPTGNVDTETTGRIFEAFRDVNEAYGVTIVIVTHDRRLSTVVDRVVAIRDGRTSSEFIRRQSYRDELASISAGGKLFAEEQTHEEFAVLDRAGRLQVPRDLLSKIGQDGAGNLKVELEDGRIVLSRPESGVDPASDDQVKESP